MSAISSDSGGRSGGTIEFAVDLLRHAAAVAYAGQRIGGGQLLEFGVGLHQFLGTLQHARFQLVAFVVQASSVSRRERSAKIGARSASPAE
jgi:hypothetical protein